MVISMIPKLTLEYSSVLLVSLICCIIAFTSTYTVMPRLINKLKEQTLSVMIYIRSRSP